MAKTETEQSAETSEKHIPEKPKGIIGNMKLPITIGVIVLVIAIPIIIVFILFKTMVAPVLNPVQPNQAQQVNADKTPKVGEAGKTENPEQQLSDEDKKNMQFVETGRMMTNPRSSTNIIVLNLGIEFLPKDKDEIADIKKEGVNSMIMKKVLSRIQGTFQGKLGDMTLEEVQAVRKDTLSVLFKSYLEPVFKDYDMYLKSVMVKEFLIQ